MFFENVLVLLFAQSVLCSSWGRDSEYGQLKLTNRNDSSSGTIIDYGAATFGKKLPDEEGEYYKGVLHDSSPRHGCSPMKSPPIGVKIPADCVWVAIIERSQKDVSTVCDYTTKVKNAQNAGYGGVVIFNYDRDDDELVNMGFSNQSVADSIVIPSVFVTWYSSLRLKKLVYPNHYDHILWAVSFEPEPDYSIDPYKILLPLAFSFVGILFITCIVMVVRWCQAIRKRQRSRISKRQLKKIPIARYKPGDKYDCCTICLDDYAEGEKLRLLPCEHTYHQKCIDPWLLKNKRTCPVCKRKVMPRPPGSRESDSEDSDNERAPLLDEATGGQEPATSNAPPQRSSYGTTNETEQQSPPSAAPPRSRIRILRPRMPSTFRRNRNEETRRYLIQNESSSSEDEENDIRTNRLLINSPTAQTPTDVQNHSLHSIPNLSNYRPTDAADSSADSDSSEDSGSVREHEVTCEVQIETDTLHNEIV